jgi:pyruvyltransferase
MPSTYAASGADDETAIPNLYWWKPQSRYGFFPRPLNLGDALSPKIVACVLKERGLWGRFPAAGQRLFAIGSILNHASDCDVVWGTGFNGTKSIAAYEFTNLDVRAVRGPRTKELLTKLNIDCPSLFGDPGILISRYVKPLQVTRPTELYIPHYSQGKVRASDIRTLWTLGDNFQSFVNEIYSSRIVYSASLHGLVIAEAYGVPAILTMTSPTENITKYRDYYEGTGRSAFPIAFSIEEARDLSPPDLPDVTAIQNRLLESFPVDLWQ